MIFKNGKYSGQKISDLWHKEGDKSYVAWACKYPETAKFFSDPKRLEELRAYLSKVKFKNPENYQAAFDLAKVQPREEKRDNEQPKELGKNLAVEIAHEILGHLIPEIHQLVSKPAEKAVSLPTYYSFTVAKLNKMKADEIILIMNELHNEHPEEVRKKHGLVIHRAEEHETFNTVTFK